MPAYALVRIKKGAQCWQDHNGYKWPPSDYGEEGRKLARVPDDQIFIGTKKVGDKVKWDCKAPGAGMKGDYGNGGIFVFGDDPVELLTPMLAYEPEIPEVDEGKIAIQKLERLEGYLHSREQHPDYEYETTTGPRKAWYDEDVTPEGDGWEANVHKGDKGWERFEYHEEAYWMRLKPGYKR